MVKTFGWAGTMGAFLLFVLVGGIYGPQVRTASGDLIEVSKRQDYATDDKTFHTNEDIYIKIGKDKVGKFLEGKAQLQVLVKQKGKSGFKEKESVPLVIQGDKTAVSYRDDVQPLFKQGGAWFNYGGTAAGACTNCHAGDVNGDGEEECPPECHLMDLGTRAGMLNGADGSTAPLFGESTVGATDYNWANSGLRKRLRNNRMPPGFPFAIDESNRDGGDIDLSNDGDDIHLGGQFYLNTTGGDVDYGILETNAIGLLEAYVSGLKGSAVKYAGSASTVTWTDVAGLFSKPNVWYNGGPACTSCHYCNTEPPCFHTIDFNTEDGLLAGADNGRSLCSVKAKLATKTLIGEIAV